tara:strand:+ start:5870 stop:6493 length:624 start_codon:yes stop_codon:yes gene_type:complete
MIAYAMYNKSFNSATGHKSEYKVVKFSSRKEASQTGNGFAIVESPDEIAKLRGWTIDEFAALFYTLKPADYKFDAKEFYPTTRKVAAERLWLLFDACDQKDQYNDDGRLSFKTPISSSKIHLPTLKPGKKLAKPKSIRNGTRWKWIKINTKANPRRANTKPVCGYASFEILLRHGADMPYDLYIKEGGRAQDINWDVKKGWAEIYET